MERDANGDKHFSNAAEAVHFLRTKTLEVVRWLHRARESGVVPAIHDVRVILNDIANITIRWIEACEAKACPHCGRSLNEG